MRVLSGLLLGACFVLGMALMVLFVMLLLRSSLLHLIKLRGGKSIPESGPNAGIGQNERIKRPAFLSGIQD
jgi:hypothetical protein